jgi:cell division protein FtsB
MASSLELGKLVAASYLYRYWKKINLLMRGYLFMAIITLILITSVGIFGYLSNAYQSASLQLEQETVQLALVDEEIERLKDERDYLKAEMKETIESYPQNYVTAKRKAREGYMTEIKTVNSSISEFSNQLVNLKTNILKTGVDVGPAVFIAKLLDTSMDNVVKILIFVLIFVFDPLAVMLMVGYNKILIEEKNG